MEVTLLEGVKVLEIGEYISAAFCTKLMTGLGAEVTKIEKPGDGDPARRLGPFPDHRPDPEKSGLYLCLNTGKRSITLNIETATGQGILKRLAAGSDLVVENLRAGKLQSLGLGYEALAQGNPSLVMCSISDFGQTGPYRDFAGGELTSQALGGIMDLTGDPERNPLRVGVHTFAYISGFAGFEGSLAALYSAGATGRGQHVDVATAEAVASGLGQSVVRYQYLNRVEQRGKSLISMFIPCQDGFVMAALAGDMWFRLAELMGGELKNDPRFLTDVARIQNFAELEALTAMWTLQRTRKEVVESGQKFGLAVDYLASVDDVVGSPQYRARDFFYEMEHPRAGHLQYPGLPFTVNGVRSKPDRAPLLGEHNEEVYRNLGYDVSGLTRLYGAGVI